MDGSLPDLRGHLAGLLAGVIDLNEFQAWYWANADVIEFGGSDEDVDLLNFVASLFDEYTSDYIDDTELLDALRTAPEVQNGACDIPRRCSVIHCSHTRKPVEVTVNAPETSASVPLRSSSEKIGGEGRLR